MPSVFTECTAIIVAAGSGRRMGFDKLSAELAGRAVLARTLDAFVAAPSISEIIVVCPAERWDALSLPFTKPVHRVDGGAERQDSVAAGLAMVHTPFVAVHDGARPLVSSDDIERCLAAAVDHHAAALARRVTDTLKRSDANDFSKEPVSREDLWFMETPQIFETTLLRAAYAQVTALRLQMTDEVSAVNAYGHSVKFVESLHPNLKITTPADLALAEALCR